jgi:hypothetical protein
MVDNGRPVTGDRLPLQFVRVLFGEPIIFIHLQPKNFPKNRLLRPSVRNVFDNCSGTSYSPNRWLRRCPVARIALTWPLAACRASRWLRPLQRGARSCQARRPASLHHLHAIGKLHGVRRLRDRSNQRNLRHAGLEPNAFSLQEPAHAAGSFQAESASARENHRVNSLGDVMRIQQAPLLGARGRTAEIAAGHRPGFEADGRAPRQSVIIGGMPHEDAGNVRQTLHFAPHGSIANIGGF